MDAKDILQSASGYQKGAITGTIAGFVLGAILKSNKFYWTIGGFLVGGYLGSLISDVYSSGSKKTEFKYFG